MAYSREVPGIIACLDQVNYEQTGLITDFQDFAVHDGPGLRVLVFLKGCPLACGWCQNPENMTSEVEIAYHEVLCRGCFRCRDVCPVSHAVLESREQRIDRSRCTKCMRCVDVCTTRALRMVGRVVSVTDVVRKVIRYRPFFEGSDRGGLTLSGGEPLFQPEFTLQVLKACRDLRIHTAIETCGYADYQILRVAAQNADLILYDIKHMSEIRHLQGTGKSNTVILRNLKRLCEEVNTEIAARIPLVPGFNDDDRNIEETAQFVSSLRRISRLDLLPFNELPLAKYKALGLVWSYARAKRQSTEQLERLQKLVESYGLVATIGGLW